MVFPLDYRLKPWDAQPTQVVLHSTGAGNPAERVLHTLETRKLSVHYVVEADGNIVQLADLKHQTRHIKGLNDMSIGIEFVNPLFNGKLRQTELARHGVQRATYKCDVVGSRPVELCEHTPAQKKSCLELLETISATHHIAKTVPTEKGKLRLTRFKSLSEARAYRGVLCHWHWHTNKLDAGTDLLRFLFENGYK